MINNSLCESNFQSRFMLKCIFFSDMFLTYLTRLLIEAAWTIQKYNLFNSGKIDCKLCETFSKSEIVSSWRAFIKKEIYCLLIKNIALQRI